MKEEIVDEKEMKETLQDVLEELFGTEPEPKPTPKPSRPKPKPTTSRTKPKKEVVPRWLLSIIDSYCKQYSGGKRTKLSGMNIREALDYIHMTEEDLKKLMESWTK